MKLTNTIENVEHFEIVGENIIIGSEPDFEGSILSHGSLIICKNSEGEKVLLNEKYFYYTAFKDGVIFNREEGGPIYFCNAEGEQEILPAGNYFSPLSSRPNSDCFFYTEMDAEFNSKHFLFDNQHERISLPTHFTMLTSEAVVQLKRSESRIDVYPLDDFDDVRQFIISPENFPNHLVASEKIDSQSKPVIDGENLLITLNTGKMLSVNWKSKKPNWTWNDGAVHSGCNFNDNYIYQNFGNGIFSINKETGQTVGKIIYEDYDIFQGFCATGNYFPYEKYIVLVDTLHGKIGVIDSKTLKPLDCYSFEDTTIPASILSVGLMDNTLYVKTMNYQLHEFELGI